MTAANALAIKFAARTNASRSSSLVEPFLARRLSSAVAAMMASFVFCVTRNISLSFGSNALKSVTVTMAC